MKYMGSKNRIAKEIIPIMLREREVNQVWVEPFVGGANIIDKIKGERIGSDINKYLIQALISIRDNVYELPKNNKEFTESDYKQLRKNDNYKFKGYAGFSYSYGGKWLGGWRRDKEGKRDYIKEAYNNALKQSEKLKDIKFICSDYTKLEIPERSFIYCDPPYKGTTAYKDKFDNDTFWKWCIEKKKQGHIIFISEYNAPSQFECVYEKEIVSSLTKYTGNKKGIERLFKLS